MRRRFILLTLAATIPVFFFQVKHAAAATVTGLSTNVLTPGSTELTISGSGFGSSASFGDQVCFNETIMSSFELPCVEYNSSGLTSWTDTQIVLTVPADTDGYMVGGYLHVYVDYAPASAAPIYHLQPTITSVDNTTVAAGLQVAISGKNFKNMFGVATADSYTVQPYFNGVAASADSSSWTGTTLTATVPSGATTGKVSLVFTLQSSGFTITAVGPDITVWQPFTRDTYSALQQYIGQVNIDKAWGLAGNGRAPIIAVIDDGVYINHPDIRNNIWINKKERIGNNKDDDQNGFIDDIYGWDFVSGEGEMTVRGTHGTMVAGIIGAKNDNGEGITGINPSVKIMPLIVCDDRIGCPTSLVTKAIYYAVQNGATIINLSLGTKATTGYTTAYNKAIKYAYDQGVVVVAAAGNGDLESGSGQDLNIIPQSPVCNDVNKNAVIGVGAVDANNFLTTWSNFGSTCVDAFAPGQSIVTAAVAKYNDLIPGSNYGYGDGTSFSAPIVTGIVSLVRQKWPYMPVKEVVDRIAHARNPSGVIDAYQALSGVYQPPRILKVDPPSLKTNKLIGERTITITGKSFSRKISVYIGYTKAKVTFVSKTQIIATFPVNELRFGKNLITIVGGDKQRSIFRWYTITK